MRQVAKVVSPIIVLLGVLIFQENRTKFVFPTVLMIASIAILFLTCKPFREHPRSAAILGFWLSPIALLWLLSERKEGRDISSFSIPIELIIAGVASMFLVSREGLKKVDLSLFLAIFLTWAVAYLSGSTGGADHMVSYLNFLGLSVDQLNNLIVAIRKTIHVSFYGSLGWLFARYLSELVAENRAIFGFAFAFSLAIAIADEYRQSFMPNRGGCLSDVFLDMSATLLVLFAVASFKAKKERNLDSP